jgi:hypothetical protein
MALETPYDISEHMQKYFASAWIYRCSISPESIRVSFIYIFPKGRHGVKVFSRDMDKIT